MFILQVPYSLSLDIQIVLYEKDFHSNQIFELLPATDHDLLVFLLLYELNYIS